MPAVNLPYVDAELDLAARGDEKAWRHFHWGYYTDPGARDDSTGSYLVATEALTEHLLTVAGVTDHQTVLDVGCGFGGTLDHLRARNDHCQLFGLNIDHRQVQRGRQLLARYGHSQGGPIEFVTADGCRLPFPDGIFDQVLAVECIFHFPSRKVFFGEASRVLKPGGRLALSDFILRQGSLTTVASTMGRVGIGEGDWYGRLPKPLSPAGYRRIGRASGLDLLVDDDITAETLPTYPALRRFYREAEMQSVLRDEEQRLQSLATVDALEDLAIGGHLGYHVLTFQKGVA